MKRCFVCLMALFIIMPGKVFAQRGCCSHHGGVAGCSSYGRQVCNDGTLSPTCTCTPPPIYGCTDRNAYNYNSNANTNDGSCKYYTYGCTDSNAYNYNSEADKDDGSCKYYTYGCTDSKATNYNRSADKDDGSCKYEETKKVSENVNKNAESINGSENDDSDPFAGIIGLGVISTGIYAYRKHKKRK